MIERTLYAVYREGDIVLIRTDLFWGALSSRPPTVMEVRDQLRHAGYEIGTPTMVAFFVRTHQILAAQYEIFMQSHDQLSFATVIAGHQALVLDPMEQMFAIRRRQKEPVIFATRR